MELNHGTVTKFLSIGCEGSDNYVQLLCPILKGRRSLLVSLSISKIGTGIAKWASPLEPCRWEQYHRRWSNNKLDGTGTSRRPHGV